MESDNKALNESVYFDSMYKTEREYQENVELESNFLSSPYIIDGHEGNNSIVAVPLLTLNNFNKESAIAQSNKKKAIKFDKTQSLTNKNLYSINSMQEYNCSSFIQSKQTATITSAVGSRKLNNKTISENMKTELQKEKDKQSHLSRHDKRQIQSIYSTIINKEKSISKVEEDKSCNYTDNVDEKNTVLNIIPSLNMHASNLNQLNVPTDRLLIEDIPLYNQIKPIQLQGKSTPSFRKLDKPPKDLKPKQQNLRLKKTDSEEKFFKRYKESKQINNNCDKPKKPATFSFNQRFYVKANDLITASNTSMLFNSSSLKENYLIDKKLMNDDDINENVESGQAPSTRQMNSITNLNSGQSSPNQVNTKKSNHAESSISLKHNTFMNKTIVNKNANSTLNTNVSSKTQKMDDVIQAKFEKYNTQTLGYESYKSYSHAKIDPASSFLERMTFYSVKNKYKLNKIEESVKSQIPKISSDEEIEIINKLIEDSNRRELAKINVVQHLALASSKSKLNNHPKLTQQEWNHFYEKSIRERAEMSKQSKEKLVKRSSEKKRLIEFEEIEEFNKFRRVVSEEKAKSIFERLSSSQPKKKAYSKEKFAVSSTKDINTGRLNCNKSSQNFRSKNSIKTTKNQSFSNDIKANLSEKRNSKPTFQQRTQAIKSKGLAKDKSKSSLNIYMSNAEKNKKGKPKLTIKSETSKSEHKLNFSGTSNSGCKTTLSKFKISYLLDPSTCSSKPNILCTKTQKRYSKEVNPISNFGSKPKLNCVTFKQVEYILNNIFV